jgi:hypothetical protein
MILTVKEKGQQLMKSKKKEQYWREHHHEQPFVKPGHTYGHYAPAYRTGV